MSKLFDFAMCFTIPLQVKKIRGRRALLEDGRMVRLDMAPRARVGGYVLAQADMAVAVVTKREALAARKAIKLSAKQSKVL